MIKNWYTDALSVWGGLNNKDKLKVLQDAENYAATLQNRKKRIVVYDAVAPSNILKNQKVEGSNFAYYKSIAKDNIFITDLDVPLTVAVYSIFHEGIHAMVDDYFHGVSNINTFMAINKLSLKEHLEYKYIQDFVFQNTPVEPLYRFCCYEEQMAYKESALMMLRLLAESSFTANLEKKLIEEYLNYICVEECTREKFIKKYSYENKMDYEQEFYRMKQAYRSERIDFSTTKKINDKRSLKLIEAYNNIHNNFKEVYKDENNPLIQYHFFEIVRTFNEYAKIVKSEKSFGDGEI